MHRRDFFKDLIQSGDDKVRKQKTLTRLVKGLIQSSHDEARIDKTLKGPSCGPENT